MINFFSISTVWFWVSHRSQEIHLQFCTGKHKPISSSPSSPALGITWSSWLGKIKHIISSKHLSSSLKANNLYLALCWRAWSTQCPHLSPSTTKTQPIPLIKRSPKTTELSELRPSITSLTLCEPKTHQTLLFPTEGDRENIFSAAWGDRFKNSEQKPCLPPHEAC